MGIANYYKCHEESQSEISMTDSRHTNKLINKYISNSTEGRTHCKDT